MILYDIAETFTIPLFYEYKCILLVQFTLPNYDNKYIYCIYIGNNHMLCNFIWLSNDIIKYLFCKFVVWVFPFHFTILTAALLWSQNPNFFYLFALFKVCGCLNRRTVQVSQTRRWVSPVDYTDGNKTAPKLDGVTKHYQQDEGEVPSHDMSIIQSVSYRYRSK